MSSHRGLCAAVTLLSLGTMCGRIAPIEVERLNGRSLQISNYAEHGGTVVVFLSTRSDKTAAAAETIQRLNAMTRRNGVMFVGVFPNPAESAEEVRTFCQDSGFIFPCYRDPEHKAAALLGATATPEAFVIDKDAWLRYRERIGKEDDTGSLAGALKRLSENGPAVATVEPADGTPISKPGPTPLLKHAYESIHFSSELIFEKIPGAPAHHASSIAEAPNGDLLVTWYGGSYDSSDDEALYISRKVVAVTGSGPNLHEGVTTLIAELMHKGVIDGVITSFAVIAHEMAGTLDGVKRVPVREHPELGIPTSLLPRGGLFEITLLTEAQKAQVAPEVEPWWDRYDRIAALPAPSVIKAAGNMSWLMGPRTERLAREAEALARETGLPLERVVGFGADPMTMIGAGAKLGLPVVVSIPQLVGGGAVGLAIGDAVSITRRAKMVAETLASADVIIESAIALAQEIHDGPFETYTGHGLWSEWKGEYSYSLRGKCLIRIDLDPNLETAWNKEREGADVQRAVDQGLPKTKLTGIPFRMEMSGFARLEDSLPVTADIGVAWPVLATHVAAELSLRLDFMSAPQETEEGKRMREWIADSIQFVDRSRMYEKARQLTQAAAID